MNRIYYKKRTNHFKKKLRVSGALISLVGLLVSIYIFSPMVSWQILYAPRLYAQNIIAPVPQAGVVDSASTQNAISSQTGQPANDDTNAATWFPSYNPNAKKGSSGVNQYTITIPKLQINNALVSTVDTDLTLHMVNYPGTASPPQNGTAVVFGHSTLPQLYDPQNYKTILTYAYQLNPGDDIIANVQDTAYDYKISSVTVVSPDDTSVFEQNYNNSYLNLITCTPPGTTAQRLIVKAKLQKI